MPKVLLLICFMLALQLVSPWCLKTVVNLTNAVTKVDYSPDGTQIVVTSITGNTVIVYDTTNFFPTFTYTPSTSTAKVARFSRDGTYIGVGLDSGKVELISGNAPFSATPAHSFTVRSKKIVDLDFNYNNNMLVVCYSDDNKFDVVDFYANVGGTRADRNRDVGQSYTACKFSMNNDVVISDTDRDIHSYDIPAAGNAINTYRTKVRASQDYTDVAVRPTTATPIKIVGAGGDSNQKDASYFFNTGANANSATQNAEINNNFITAPSQIMRTACYGGDALNYAVAGDDKKIWVFDDATNSQQQVLYDGLVNFMSCDFSPDGGTLIAGTVASGANAYVYVYTRTCFFCSPGYYASAITTCTACTISLTSCSMCINSTYCTGCFQGYFLQLNDTCSSCISAMQGCSTCQTSAVCIECNQGYYLQTSLCHNCGVRFPGCLACNSSLCFVCEMNYYKAAGGNCTTCHSSIGRCQRCTASNVCLQCMEGYYVTGGGTSCPACDPICLICYATSTNCSSCKRGYYLNVNTCTGCAANCLECTSATTCLDCAEGYYSTSTGCVLCTQPCTTCLTTATNCLSCNVGHYFSTNTCPSCINNCSLCISATNCSACNVGYYHTASDTCLACAQQYVGCTQCQLGACLSCDQTRYLASATSCTVCNTAMSGCQFCLSNTVCTLCGVGYYHTASTGTTACSLCSPQCQLCSSATNCYACTVGFFLSGNTCTRCSSPCTTCNATAIDCLSCQSGMYFNSTNCLNCTDLPYCLSCLSSTYCIGCQFGFYSLSGMCTSCPSNCLQCNSTHCQACNVGYYLSANLSCSPCALNCSICSASNVCISCNVGFYFDTSLSTDQCLSCSILDSSCLNCNSTNCYVCASGYYLDTFNYLCTSCSLNVTYCSLCSSALVCSVCRDGFYLASASSCISCSSLTGCIACTDASTCSLCANGYYLDTGVCYACPGNCSACTSATNCTICASSYYFSSSQCPSCEDILMGCESCANVSVCLSCGGGYLLVGNLCEPCANSIPACSLCNVSGVCQSCQQGYFLNTTNNCQLCSSSASLAGCLLCNSSTICQYCAGGYYLSSGTCSLCSPSLLGCEQCLNVSVCLDCATGYYLNPGTNGCQLCQISLAGCILCSSNTTCIQCQGGYFLNGSTCSACTNPGCQICDSTTPTNCITCNSGYYLTGNTCTFCPQVGCLYCNSTECLSCQSGYYLSAGSCILCSSTMSGCSKCSSSSACMECESLFYLSGNNCLVCSSAMVGCSFCTTSTACLACDGGYYLNGASCSPCSDVTGCLICNGSSSCLTCNSGYYAVNSTCVQCNGSLANCFQCYNDSFCTACESGFQKTAAGGCQAMQISSGGSQASAAPAELTFTTFYVSNSVLKHALSVSDKSSAYQNINSHDWPTVARIYVQNKQGATLLTVNSVYLSSDKCTLFFLTNNPASVSSQSMPVANKGRILVLQGRTLAGQSMNQLTMQSSIALPKSVVNNILPSVLLSQDLSMSYNLDDSKFYVTYVKESYQLYYFLFGLTITILLFLYGFTRATCLSFYSRNIEIVGHCLALKTVSLVIYPTYAEYVNFCLGFMAVDLPWLNNLLPESFFNDYDIAPTGYFFYFHNMNLASTHFFTGLIVLFFLIFSYGLLSETKANQIRINDKHKTVVNFKFKGIKEFILNFFGFGLAFSGFSSILGAFLNYSSTLSLSGLFYILGVIVYGLIFSQACACVVLQKRVNRLRIVLKASFLAGAGLNPLYLSSVAMIVDAILLGIEYKILKDNLLCPKSWLASNILILSALVSLFFIPDSFLTLAIVMILVVASLTFQVYQFCCQKALDQARHMKLFQKEQNIVSEGHFWNLEQKHQSEVDLSEKEGQKDSPPKSKKDDFVFQVGNIQDETIPNTTITSNFQINPLDPKRRTRKFRQQQDRPQRAQRTKDSWNLSYPGRESIFLEQ